MVERAIVDGENDDRRPVSDENSTTRDPFESGSVSTHFSEPEAEW